MWWCYFSSLASLTARYGNVLTDKPGKAGPGTLPGAVAGLMGSGIRPTRPHLLLHTDRTGRKPQECPCWALFIEREGGAAVKAPLWTCLSEAWCTWGGGGARWCTANVALSRQGLTLLFLSHFLYHLLPHIRNTSPTAYKKALSPRNMN